MKKFYILSVLIIACFCGYAVQSEKITGRVECGGRGVDSVVVTDGENFATTNSKGEFTLIYGGSGRFIYISLPNGYNSAVENGINRFYQEFSHDRKRYDFTLYRSAKDQSKHGFIAVADPQICFRKEFAQLQIAAEDIRSTVASYGDMPFHGVGCGDITSYDHSIYPQYNSIMAHSGITFFNCMGNHDMLNNGRTFETSQKKFEDFFGPAYYSYNVGRVHYVVLNDNFYIGREYFYIGYLEERQMAWLEHDLKYIKKGSTVVVCMHIPSSCDPSDRKKFQYATSSVYLCNHKGLYELLSPYNAHIISGHTHTMSNQQITTNLYEHVTAALCGAWWQGNLCTDGTPRGYGVYLVDGDSIRWYYKSTGLTKEHQMSVYDGKQHKEFDGYIVANVWNRDFSWTVDLYENGVKTCTMESFEGYDPEVKLMLSDPSKLDHKGILPSVTKHLYRAKPTIENSRKEVVAKDRFGNIYRQTL